MSLLANPFSKSPAIENPVKAPPIETACKQGPHVLERDVAGRVVEARHVGYPRQAAGEGDEEEQREERRGEEGGVGEVLVDLAPRYGKGHIEEPAHPYATLVLSEAAAPPMATTTIARAKPKPRIRACGSQPVITRLRMPSTR